MLADRMQPSNSPGFLEYISFAAAAKDDELKPIVLEAKERYKDSGDPIDDLKFYFLSPESNFLALGDIISQMVHDLKNPLAIIRGLSQVADSKLNPQKKYNYFNKIIKQVDELNQKISELVYLFNPINMTKSTPASIIDDVIKGLEPSGDFKGVQIDFTSECRVQIPLAVILFKKTIENILTSAIEALPRGSRIIVGCRCKKGKILINISLWTQDFSSYELEDLFSTFTNGPQGSSLVNMFMANYCAKMHNGKAWIEAIPKKNVAFYMALPI